MKEYKEVTQKELTFKEVAGTETSTPSECMMLLEMTRKNQSRVVLLTFDIGSLVLQLHMPVHLRQYCKLRISVVQRKELNVLY